MIARDKFSVHAVLGIALAALTSLESNLAHAQGYDYPRDDVGDGTYDCDGECTGPRTLGGHTFVPSTIVDWPFIVSRVASTTSGGVAELDVASQRLAMRLGIDGTDDFVYADQSFLGSVAITQWLSLAIRGQGSIIVPTGRNGAVLLGEHVLYGGNAIAALRLARTDRFQATLLADVGLLRPTSLVPARLPNSPFQEGELTTVRPGLAVAYAFSPRLGLQASGSYSWQWFDVVDEDTFRTLSGSAALTFDVRTVPLTFLLAGMYAHEFGESTAMDAMDAVFGTGDSKLWAEAGVVFRGVDELDLGVAFDYKLNDTAEESRWFGQLRLAYYFL